MPNNIGPALLPADLLIRFPEYVDQMLYNIHGQSLCYAFKYYLLAISFLKKKKSHFGDIYQVCQSMPGTGQGQAGT